MRLYDVKASCQLPQDRVLMTVHQTAVPAMIAADPRVTVAQTPKRRTSTSRRKLTRRRTRCETALQNLRMMMLFHSSPRIGCCSSALRRMNAGSQGLLTRFSAGRCAAGRSCMAIRVLSQRQCDNSHSDDAYPDLLLILLAPPPQTQF